VRYASILNLGIRWPSKNGFKNFFAGISQNSVALVSEGKNNPIKTTYKILGENKMFNKIAISLTVFMLLIGASCSAMAQGKQAQPATKKVSIMDLVNLAREGRSKADPEIVRAVQEAYSEPVAVRGENASMGNDLTGTWYIVVPGAAPFSAYHTFGSDGTFVETSSLLGMNGEGPAHGTWERSFRGSLLTFELFAFDPATGETVGRIRVRNFVRINNGTLSAIGVVDFIELDGTVIENIDTGTFTGERVRARSVV
jgi:hypothetical protein